MHLGVCDNSFKETCLIPGHNVQWQSYQQEVKLLVPGHISFSLLEMKSMCGVLICANKFDYFLSLIRIWSLL